MIWRILTLAAAILAIAGCGQSNTPSTQGALKAYLARVEPIRLQVNRLLDRADPTLSAYGDHRLSTGIAHRRIDELERRFAAYGVEITTVRPVPEALRTAQESYAHTYVLEDAYLSALAAALPERQFDNLPNTQSQQRAAIVAWRIRLEVLANRLKVRLPTDIQAAGRGEIAPAPSGS